MPQFIIVYFGGDQAATPEEGKQHQEKYRAWLASLGDSAISPLNPLKNTRTIVPKGDVTHASLSTMSGYTLIETDSMDSALVLAKACPFLEIGGTLEVSELIDMSSR